MATVSYRDLIKVCEALGLEFKHTKKRAIYKGIANSQLRRISIHAHAGGRDIPDGIF